MPSSVRPGGWPSSSRGEAERGMQNNSKKRGQYKASDRSGLAGLPVRSCLPELGPVCSAVHRATGYVGYAVSGAPGVALRPARYPNTAVPALLVVLRELARTRLSHVAGARQRLTKNLKHGLSTVRNREQVARMSSSLPCVLTFNMIILAIPGKPDSDAIVSDRWPH